ncbi:MAG: hypothetical protein EOM18_01870 [Clostridia bacterium]|nr:hypothetical protein [Clostridia bacterium]
MEQDPFKEYLKQTEPNKREKGYAWNTAIGLQAVDGLKTSSYLVETAIQNIEGEISIDEAQQLLDTYYEENPKSEQDELHNRSMHVSEIYKNYQKADIQTQKADIESEKADIQTRKADIESEKADIQTRKSDIQNIEPDIAIPQIYGDLVQDFSDKTIERIKKMYAEFGTELFFGRADVQNITQLGHTRASELIKELAEANIIEKVSGHGKGKYRFCKGLSH